ncbi:MAG: HAD family hydrolase [Planctomycetota bacterium]
MPAIQPGWEPKAPAAGIGGGRRSIGAGGREKENEPHPKPPAPSLLPFPRPTRGVLFDLDGTLVDSEPLHFESTNRVLARFGFHLEASAFAGFIGSAEDLYWESLKGRFPLPGTPGELADLRTAEMLALLRESKMETLPGVLPLLDFLDAAGIPRAIASSAPRPQIAASLRAAGLDSRFPVFLSGHEDVARSKPAPDIYRAAAARLEVSPRDCIAVEDSATGVAAARAAGVFVVAVPSPGHPDPALEEAHLLLDSLEDLLPYLERGA